MKEKVAIFHIDNGQMKSTLSNGISSTTSQSKLAPIVSFDEHGDIPLPMIHSPNNLPAKDSKKICCHWKISGKKSCQFLLQYLFSQSGLMIIVVVYIIFGGFLFYGIESNYEPRRNQQIKSKHIDGIRNLRRITNEEFNWMLNTSFELRYALWRGILSRLDGYDRTGWRVHVSAERFDRLIEQELARMQAQEEKFLDKHDARSNAVYNQKWTYSTAMLYSATVITTVGYGNITPKSMIGKLLTCLYAIIGIPIMIMYLTITGDILAFCFVKYYSATRDFIRRKIGQRKKRTNSEIDTVPTQQHVPIIAAVGVVVLYIFTGAVLFSHWEGWSYIDGAYFSFITFTTIGLGDLVPGKGTMTDNKNGKSILCAVYLLFGLVVTTMCFRLIQDDLFAMKQRFFARFGFHVYYHQRPRFYHFQQ